MKGYCKNLGREVNHPQIDGTVHSGERKAEVKEMNRNGLHTETDTRMRPSAAELYAQVCVVCEFVLSSRTLYNGGQIERSRWMELEALLGDRLV